MRPRARRLPPVLLPLLVVIALLPFGCQGSSTVTGPSGGAVASANIAGTWSGSYQSDDMVGCGTSSASATFQQTGNVVTGSVSTSKCGVTGIFKGTVQGNTVMGAVAQEGCVGGGASGTINGSDLVLSIGDMTKPLVTGDKSIMYGGVVSFHR
jgi:hypothetical protein